MPERVDLALVSGRYASSVYPNSCVNPGRPESGRDYITQKFFEATVLCSVLWRFMEGAQPRTSCNLFVTEQSVYEALRHELVQVVWTFTHADEPHGNAQ